VKPTYRTAAAYVELGGRQSFDVRTEAAYLQQKLSLGRRLRPFTSDRVAAASASWSLSL
jgi:hypothetical protein